MVCKKQVGHALSVPDREESHLLSEDLGSGEPVSRASAQKKRKKIWILKIQTDVLMLNAQNLNKFRFQIKYFVCNENVLSKE